VFNPRTEHEGRVVKITHMQFVWIACRIIYVSGLERLNCFRRFAFRKLNRVMEKDNQVKLRLCRISQIAYKI